MIGSPMKRNLLGFVMRYGMNKEKNTKLGEGLRRLIKESHGIRKKKIKCSSIIQFVKMANVGIRRGAMNNVVE